MRPQDASYNSHLEVRWIYKPILAKIKEILCKLIYPFLKITPIRRVYDEESEAWYFSVIAIIRALTQQSDYQTARKYWNKLKERLKDEGCESVPNCHRLKLVAADAKGVPKNTIASKKGAGIAKHARIELESKTGKKVITKTNYLDS